MAKKNDALLIRLRADIDGLKASLDAADKTISQKVSAINKAKSKTKLGFDVAIAEAQAAGKATDVLRLKREKLTEVIKLERLQLEELQKAYDKAEGKNKDYLAEKVAKQRIQIAKNEAYLNKLNQPTDLKTEAVKELSSQFPKIASGIGLVKKAIAALGPAGAAIAVTAGSFALMKQHIEETRQKLLEAADATYKVTEHLSDLADLTQLPIGEVEQLAEACKVAGANIDSIAPAINKLDKAVLGGDKTLEQFGVKLTNASGGLLSTAEQLQVLADAYSRMKAEGRGAEFVAELGKQASALLPLISRFGDADFSNVKEMLDNAPKLSTMLEEDAKYIGELDRALETLNKRLENATGAEATQLKINEVTRAIEAAQKEMEVFLKTADSRAYERMGIDSLDEQFQALNLSIIEAKGSLKSLISEFTGWVTMRSAFVMKNYSEGKFSWGLEDFEDYKAQQSIKADQLRQKRDNDRLDAILGRKKMEQQSPEEYSASVRKDIEKNFAYATAERKEALYNQKMLEYSEQRKKMAEKEAEVKQKSAEKANEKRIALEHKLRDALATEQQKRVNAINDNYEKNAKDDPVMAEKIRQAELNRLAEDNARAEQRRLEEEKRKQDEIARARQDAMDKIRAITNTDFQNRLDQIEKEKQAWIKAGADRASAEIAAQKQIADAQKQARDSAMSEAERTLTEYRQIIKDIQKGLSDEEITARADKRWMKNRGINQSMIDTMAQVGQDRIKELGDSRSRLLGKFAEPKAVNAPITINFDGTVVEDMSSMQKIADKVSEVITPAIERALRGESTYGY